MKKVCFGTIIGTQIKLWIGTVIDNVILQINYFYRITFPRFGKLLCIYIFTQIWYEVRLPMYVQYCTVNVTKSGFQVFNLKNVFLRSSTFHLWLVPTLNLAIILYNLIFYYQSLCLQWSSTWANVRNDPVPGLVSKMSSTWANVHNVLYLG